MSVVCAIFLATGGCFAPCCASVAGASATINTACNNNAVVILFISLLLMLLKRLPSLSDPFLDGSGQAALWILSHAARFAQGDFIRRLALKRRLFLTGSYRRLRKRVWVMVRCSLTIPFLLGVLCVLGGFSRSIQGINRRVR